MTTNYLPAFPSLPLPEPAEPGQQKPDNDPFGVLKEFKALNPAPAPAAPAAPNYEQMIRDEATRQGVDPEFMLKIYRQEGSQGNPRARSPKGALGLLQIMPNTGRKHGVSVAQLFDPETNIRVGVAEARDMLVQTGSAPLGAAAYNAGLKAVQKHGGVPPYHETRQYVANTNNVPNTDPFGVLAEFAKTNPEVAVAQPAEQPGQRVTNVTRRRGPLPWLRAPGATQQPGAPAAQPQQPQPVRQQFRPDDLAAANFEVLKRGDTLKQLKPEEFERLVAPLRQTGWEIGADYIKPPAGKENQYPLWQWQLQGAQGPRPQPQLPQAPDWLKYAAGFAGMPNAETQYLYEMAAPMAGLAAKTIGSGIQAASQPYNPLPAIEAAKGVYSLTLEPQVQQWQKAAELYAEKNKGKQIHPRAAAAALSDPEIAAHYAMAFVPFVGPILAGMSEEAGTGAGLALGGDIAGAKPHLKAASQQFLMLAVPEALKLAGRGATPDAALRGAVDIVERNNPELLAKLRGAQLREPVNVETGTLGTGAKPKLTAADIAHRAPTLEEYTNQSVENLKRASRTIAGEGVSAAAQPGKEALFVEGITPEEASKRAEQNARSATQFAHENIDRQFTDTEDLLRFTDDLSRTVNKGILKDTSLNAPVTRRIDSEKYNYTKVSDLADARQQFATELLDRLNRGEDPRETAAWIEWRGNYTDHFWADGSGRTSRALADWVLMRNGEKLPKAVPMRDVAVETRRTGASGEQYLGPDWQKFHDEYMKGFEGIERINPQPPPAPVIQPTQEIPNVNVQPRPVSELLRPEPAAGGQEAAQRQAIVPEAQRAEGAAAPVAAQAAAAKVSPQWKVHFDEAVRGAEERMAARRAKAGTGESLLKSFIKSETGELDIGVLHDAGLIGASKIARGISSRADWTKEMIREFGDAIKPYLNDVYERARAILGVSQKAPERRLELSLPSDLEGFLPPPANEPTVPFRPDILQELRTDRPLPETRPDLGGIVRRLREGNVRPQEAVQMHEQVSGLASTARSRLEAVMNRVIPRWDRTKVDDLGFTKGYWFTPGARAAQRSVRRYLGDQSFLLDDYLNAKRAERALASLRNAPPEAEVSPVTWTGRFGKKYAGERTAVEPFQPGEAPAPTAVGERPRPATFTDFTERLRRNVDPQEWHDLWDRTANDLDTAYRNLRDAAVKVGVSFRESVSSIKAANLEKLRAKLPESDQHYFDDFLEARRRKNALLADLAERELGEAAITGRPLPARFSAEDIPADIRSQITEAADTARSRTQAFLRSESGELDFNALYDAMLIGMDKLVKLGNDKAAWIKAMSDELGDVIKPDLERLYRAAAGRLAAVQQNQQTVEGFPLNPAKKVGGVPEDILRQLYDQSIKNVRNDRSFTPEQEIVSRQTMQNVLADPQHFINRYHDYTERAKIDPKIISTDDAKEAWPFYASDRARWSQAFHEPSSLIAKIDLYQRLHDPKFPKNPRIEIRAGGQASGKSTSIDIVKGKGQTSADLIYDTMFSNASGNKRLIDSIFEARPNASVVVDYIHRPVYLAAQGALQRAIPTPEGEPLRRPVPATSLGKGHYNAQNAFLDTYELYKDDPRITFNVIDNSGQVHEIRPADIELLRANKYGSLNEATVEAQRGIEDAYRQGWVTPELYEATTGRRPETPNRAVLEGERGVNNAGISTPSRQAGGERPTLAGPLAEVPATVVHHTQVEPEKVYPGGFSAFSGERIRGDRTAPFGTIFTTAQEAAPNAHARYGPNAVTLTPPADARVLDLTQPNPYSEQFGYSKASQAKAAQAIKDAGYDGYQFIDNATGEKSIAWFYPENMTPAETAGGFYHPGTATTEATKPRTLAEARNPQGWRKYNLIIDPIAKANDVHIARLDITPNRQEARPSVGWWDNAYDTVMRTVLTGARDKVEYVIAKAAQKANQNATMFWQKNPTGPDAVTHIQLPQMTDSQTKILTDTLKEHGIEGGTLGHRELIIADIGDAQGGALYDALAEFEQKTRLKVYTGTRYRADVTLLDRPAYEKVINDYEAKISGRNVEGRVPAGVEATGAGAPLPSRAPPQETVPRPSGAAVPGEAPAEAPKQIAQPRTREEFQTALQQHFGYAADVAEATGAVADALADTYAKRSGRPKSDFYSQINVTEGGPIGPGLEQRDLNKGLLSSPEAKKFLEGTKVVDKDGNPQILYHQTRNENVKPIEQSGFEFGREGSGNTDYQTPLGIFMKPTKRTLPLTNDIQDERQIPLVVSMKNPLHVKNRDELIAWAKSHSEDYRQKAEAFKTLTDKLADELKPKQDEINRKINNRQPEDVPEAERREIIDLMDQFDVAREAALKKLAAAAGPAREALTKAMKDAGYDGLIMDRDQGALSWVKTYIAFDPTQVKHAVKNVGTFDPTKPSILLQDAFDAEGNPIQAGPRAITEFRISGEAVIRALENPNQSTAIHEMHHAAVPLFMRLAAREGEGAAPSPEFISDMNHLARFMGMEDANEFVAAHQRFVEGTLEGVEREKYIAGQEKGARGFEEYLRTGKAPTTALARVFAQFKEWLSKIYQSSVEKIGAQQREIWDRLLGGETEAAAAPEAAKPVTAEAAQAAPVPAAVPPAVTPETQQQQQQAQPATTAPDWAIGKRKVTHGQFGDTWVEHVNGDGTLTVRDTAGNLHRIKNPNGPNGNRQAAFVRGAPEGMKERSLPKTLEAAGLEPGNDLYYWEETIQHGVQTATAAVLQKGVDASIENVLAGSPGIDWAPTGYATMHVLREEKVKARQAGNIAEADRLARRLNDFVGEFANRATELGQSIAGIRAIEEFAPEQALVQINRISQKVRNRPLTLKETERVEDVSMKLKTANDAARQAYQAAVMAKAEFERTQPPTHAKTYQDVLDQQSYNALRDLKAKKGAFDFGQLTRPSEAGAVTIGEPPLPGDAELLAQYAAARLRKVKTVAELNKEITDIAPQAESILPAIRRRAYAIREEARANEIADASPERIRTVLQEIRAEVAKAKAEERAAEFALKTMRREDRRAFISEARTQAAEARAQSRAELEAIAQEARERYRSVRQEFLAAAKAENAQYRTEQRAARIAERHAKLWDTPLRLEAAAARERLKTGDPNAPETVNDLVTVGVEKMLPVKPGGPVRPGPMTPGRFYREMSAEFPDLVNQKNRMEIFRRSFELREDALRAAREAARLASASRESRAFWENAGIDVDTQAILIRRAEATRRQLEARAAMMEEFGRVSRSRFARVLSEVQAIPRALQSSVDAPLGRQGLFYTITHPIISSRATIPTTYRGYRSFNIADFAKAVEELQRRPIYDLFRRAGGDWTVASTSTYMGDPGIPSGEITSRLAVEEPFQSSVASRLPHVRLSDQAFNLSMNAQRLTLFDHYATLGFAEGYTWENNPEFFKQAAQRVNIATGRGSLGVKAQAFSSNLNWLFYSTRLNMSRFQLLKKFLWPADWWRADPLMRKIVAGEAIRLAGGLAAIYTTARVAGLNVTFDPDDPDFMKIRIGNRTTEKAATSYDPTGGEGNLVRFVVRLVKSAGEAEDGNLDAMDSIIKRYVRQKLAPWPGAAIDLNVPSAIGHLAREDVEGAKRVFGHGTNLVGTPANLEFLPPTSIKNIHEMTERNTAIRMVIPMIVGDLMDSIEEEGWKGAAKTAPGLTGISVQTYKESPESQIFKEKKAAGEFRKKAIENLRKNPQATAPLDEAVRKGELTREQRQQIIETAKLSPLEQEFKRKSIELALAYYRKATPEQQKILRPLLLEKWASAAGLPRRTKTGGLERQTPSLPPAAVQRLQTEYAPELGRP